MSDTRVMMPRSVVFRSLLLASTGILLALPAQAAFDPNADQQAAAASKGQSLPDTRVLYGDAPVRPLYAPNVAPANGAPNYVSPVGTIQMPQKPLYPMRSVPAAVAAPAAPIEAAPVIAAPAVIAPVEAAPVIAAPAPLIAPAPVLAPVVVAEPAPAVVVPVIEPAPVVAAAPVVDAPAILPIAAPVVVAPSPIVIGDAESAPVTTEAVVEVPPIAADRQVAAQAQSLLQAEAAQPAPMVMQPIQDTGFIAPAPLVADSVPVVTQPMPIVAESAPVTTPVAVVPVMPPVEAPVVAVAPVVQPVPVVVPMVEQPKVVVVPPAATLTEETRDIASTIPSRIDTPVAQPTSKLSLSRVTPQIQDVLGTPESESAYESTGISIKVRRPGLDTNYELNRAYTSLMGGDTDNAVSIYKDILSTEPKNQDALFGLAATYHRLGRTAEARPVYGALLKTNPNHREGLNNFLILMSEESPQDALPELQRLEERNPDFSPIPAQIAIVLDRLGYPDEAEDKLLRAIELSPDNLSYKYNLAIMLDRHGRYADASALYRMLIEEALRGGQVPASVDTMQRRLNFIATAANGSKLGS